MLPILVVLFVVSYCLLTLLVFEQGQTIESQRSLIRSMMQDSTQLAALKNKLAEFEGQRAQNQPSASANEKNAPAAAAPQAGKSAKQPSKTEKSMRQAPGKPESDLEDVRRRTRII